MQNKITKNIYDGYVHLGDKFSYEMLNEIDRASSTSDIFELFDNNLDGEVSKMVIKSIFDNMKLKFADYWFELETDRLKGYLPIIDWGSQTGKDALSADTVYFLSFSTSLKNSMIPKLIFFRNLIKKSNISVSNYKIIHISNDVNGIVPKGEALFKVSEYGNGSQSSKTSRTRLFDLTTFMNEEVVDFVEYPSDNRGNSIDYAKRFRFEVIKLGLNFERHIDQIISGVFSENPSLSYKIKKNGTTRWLNNSAFDDFHKNHLPVNTSNPSFLYKQTPYAGLTLDKLGKKTVLFDFETITFPFAVYDNCPAYSQVPVQYSIIVIDNDKQVISEKNVIFDFSDTSNKAFVDYFIKMIKDIYVEGAIYVSHHKVFEDSVMEKMYRSLWRSNEYYKSELIGIQDKMSNITDPIQSIDTNIIYKGAFSFDGFPEKSSIKYINKWLWEHEPQLNKNYGVKSYEDELLISSGLFAMKELSKMYLGLNSSEHQEEMKKDLIDYCRNDVLSMIPLLVFFEREQKIWWNKKEVYMEWKYVESSNVNKIAVDGTTLFVCFHNGSCYSYDNAGHHFDEMFNASSVGSYFNANVKNGNYPFSKVN